MKTSCSDIWTECQSRSELEEDDDDEAEAEANRRPPEAAPFSPSQDAINLECDEGSRQKSPRRPLSNL